MPTFRSRAVSEDGYYQIDFTTFGISLTKITKDDSLLLPMSHWVYLLTNQYVEGQDHHNYVKRMDVGGLQPPLPFNSDQLLIVDHDAIVNAVYGSPNTKIPYFNGSSVPRYTGHECKFVRYVGLSESFNHCESCGKKQ